MRWKLCLLMLYGCWSFYYNICHFSWSFITLNFMMRQMWDTSCNHNVLTYTICDNCRWRAIVELQTPAMVWSQPYRELTRVRTTGRNKCRWRQRNRGAAEKKSGTFQQGDYRHPFCFLSAHVCSFFRPFERSFTFLVCPVVPPFVRFLLRFMGIDML